MQINGTLILLYFIEMLLRTVSRFGHAWIWKRNKLQWFKIIKFIMRSRSCFVQNSHTLQRPCRELTQSWWSRGSLHPMHGQHTQIHSVHFF